jgi:Catechol dioxygenase N terminus
MDPSKVKIPPLKDLNTDNITDNVNLINSNNPDTRSKYVLERLVVHLHDFARETRLSTREWMAGIEFLTRTGKMCSDVRQVWTIENVAYRLLISRRNSSSSPTFSASHSWSIASTTRNPQAQRTAPSSAHSTRTKRSTSHTARRSRMTRKVNRCWFSVR